MSSQGKFEQIDLDYESETLIYENMKTIMSGRESMPIDFDLLIGIGGESVVAAYGSDKVVKIVQIMEPDGTTGSASTNRRKDGLSKKNENKSQKVSSPYVLTPTNFVLQIVGNRTFYLFGK